MKHVAPHRWADAWAGKLADAEVAAIERHAESCPRCAKARDRITRTSSQTFPALRAQSAPDLAWDSVRAKVHWSLASERRARTQASPSLLGRIGFGLVASGGLAALLATATLHHAPPAAVTPVAAQRTQPASDAPAAVQGLVSRLAGDVLVDGLRSGAFDRRIHAGAVIATGDGRVDVQFGERSAFALGAHSKLELRRFDAAQIELVVDGTVDVEVAKRAPGQRFLVIAGGDTIEVRGTQFRVAHDGRGVHVACHHGLVTVGDGSGEPQQVGAARELDLATGRAVIDAHVQQMSADELAQLVAATPVTTPLWTDADATAKSSAALEIATPDKRDVRVDGVELGQAPLRVRVMPGRHTVEAADPAGRYHRAGWVDTSADQPAHVDVRPEPAAAATPSAAERQRQLHAGIAAHRAQLARCTRAMAKAGVTDVSVDIGIGVTASGDVDHLNVDTDLPATTRTCIEDALHDIRFGPGAAAEWREKLPL
jgi:hypothetical protein